MSPKASRSKSAPSPAPAALAARWRAPLLRFLHWRWSPTLLALVSGAFAGLCSPGSPAPWLWVVVYVPFFVALDVTLGGAPLPDWPRWRRGFWLCWVAGVGMAWGNGDWIVNTAYVYGHLPLALAWGVNLFAYGTLFGVETFFFLGLPFLLGLARPLWGFWLVLLWSSAWQGLLPRFFSWTFGHMIHPQPFLTQAADLVGSAGLNFWLLSLQLVLFAWVRGTYGEPLVSRRVLGGTAGGVALLFAAGAFYGQWREAGLEQAEAVGQPVNLVGVQPNFSLGSLASNPALSHSDRRQSLNALLQDTARGLEQVQAAPGIPTVVVWPESVYPVPFFRATPARMAVEWWARVHQIHLVLASIAQGGPRPDGRGREVFGAAIHRPPEEGPAGVYRKISLIPFGETIPLGATFPWFRDWLEALIPQIADFTPGAEYTVFRVNEGIRLAPMICFDAIREGVARGMTRNGANLGLILANTAWFGKTNVSGLMEYAARFRAIENRIPILLVSQNGESVMLGATGRAITPRTTAFEPAVVTLRARVPQTWSFFSAYAGWVNGAYLAGVVLLFAWRLAPLVGVRGGGRVPARAARGGKGKKAAGK